MAKIATRFLEKATGRLSRVVHSVGGLMLAAMMFLTFADVCLRYVFNRPIKGAYEIEEYMMAILVAFSLAYCAVRKGNVRVEILFTRFSPRGQVIAEAFTTLLGLVFFFLVTWQGILYIGEMRGSGLVSSVLLIPAFPFVAVVAFGCALLWLVLMTDFLGLISRVLKK